ncbi:MAG TPA: hypothetical protein VNT51_07740 [Miltoncostaeaceae bacterium]|nr:hypothetical protein [Miltoncostaeaceae bacterium]
MADPVPAPAPAQPVSYRLLGPPDLLHDLQRDFEEIGWRTSVVRWQAVVTAPPEDADHRAPQWPAEVTLVGVASQAHEEACAEYLAGPAV